MKFLRRNRHGEAPRRQIGMRITCTRCGEWTRVPTASVRDGCYPVTCGACILDDIQEAVKRRPSPRLFGQELQMGRWYGGNDGKG